MCLVACRNPKCQPTNGHHSAKGRFVKLLLSIFLSQITSVLQLYFFFLLENNFLEGKLSLNVIAFLGAMVYCIPS